MFNSFQHIHFIGIGGSGISAIARWVKHIGKKVSGSDVTMNKNLQDLKKQGIECYIGHQKEHLIDTVDMVIFSEAIDKETNPEYRIAKKKGLKVMSYFEALGEISRTKKTVVVVGTHGKTTTTAMLGQALIQTDINPNVVVGSRVGAFGNSNLYLGKSEWLVVEGCEYRRSFLYLKPFGVVFLNCEAEHLDYYKDETDYKNAFKDLIQKIPKEGFLVYNRHDDNVTEIKKLAQCETFGIDSNFQNKLNLKLKVIGSFNFLNASHAYQAAVLMEGQPKKVKKGLEEFTGTVRRMETKGERKGVLVIDDYAHHPTEIKATLKALREKHPKKRIVCVFQPHQYSRTHQMKSEFEKAFEHADWVMIPNIYEARDTDEDKKKINAATFANLLSQNHPKVEHTSGTKKTTRHLLNICKSGDIIITMGAGDVYKIGESFLRG